MHKTSKIYIAGHRGLVGSALVKSLIKKGYNNLVTRTHGELDLIDQSAVTEFFKNEKPEYVLLAAAKVGGIHANNTYRAEFIYDNLMIQNNVIHQSYLSGVKKLLFLGSTCIYPGKAPQPMKEDHLLTSELEYTNEPYAIAKIAGIKLCESYNLQYGTNFISVMPTNLYGLNDNFNLENAHVLPALVRKIYLAKLLQNRDRDAVLKDLEVADWSEAEVILGKFGISGDSVEIWGSGNPRREFLYSDDMADACVFLMENRDFNDTYDPSNRNVRNTHINLGTGKDISIRELALLIKDVAGYKGNFIFNTSKPDGTMVKLTDPSKLHSLGWEHRIEIQEGIRLVYDWYVHQSSGIRH